MKLVDEPRESYMPIISCPSPISAHFSLGYIKAKDHICVPLSSSTIAPTHQPREHGPQKEQPASRGGGSRSSSHSRRRAALPDRSIVGHGARRPAAQMLQVAGIKAKKLHRRILAIACSAVADDTAPDLYTDHFAGMEGCLLISQVPSRIQWLY